MLKFNLLPNYFKKIGIGLISVSAVFFILKLAGDVTQWNGVPTKYFTLSLLIGGLTVIALSRDKIEDEMNMQRRATHLSGAFIFGVVILIVRPFIDVIFGGEIEELSSYQLVLTMVGYYLFTFNLDKKVNR